MLFVPVALYILPLAGVRADVHLVASLSLAQGLCAVVAGALFHLRRGHLEFKHLWSGGLALGCGALAGGLLSAWTPSWALTLLFAIVASAAAVLLLIDPARVNRWPSAHSRLVAFGLFIGIGALGGAVGVGAGVLIIPVLLYVLATDPRSANGTGLLLPAFTALPAFIGKTVTGQVEWDLMPAVVVLGLAGGALGAAITVAISPFRLRRGLAGLTALLAGAVWVQLVLPLLSRSLRP